MHRQPERTISCLPTIYVDNPIYYTLKVFIGWIIPHPGELRIECLPECRIHGAIAAQWRVQLGPGRDRFSLPS